MSWKKQLWKQRRARGHLPGVAGVPARSPLQARRAGVRYTDHEQANGERGALVIRFDQIESASLTDVGVRRSHNQDNLAVSMAPDLSRWKSVGHLFLVADGMGGHAVGEKASEMAAAIIPHTYEKHVPEGTPAALRKAFLEANASINACGEQNSEFRGMGTTSTALVLREEGAWLAHVGDSRAYRIRSGVIEQLTYDHSYVWEYARLKGIDPDMVKDFPSNVIHRCLGPQPVVQVDIEGPHPLEPGDIFLLCSDGLSGQVEDHEIAVVASVLPAEEACRFLIDLANLRGGPDNITVIIVRVEGSTPEGTVRSKPAYRPSKPFWQQPLPWPMLSLLSGMALASLAIVLRLASESGKAVAMLVFLAAVGSILAGVVGLVLEQKRRRNAPGDEEGRTPQVHRRRPWHLDRAMLDKIAKAAKTLKERADALQWDPDVATYDAHHEKAEELARRGDLAGAFREYCRAMRPLTAACQKNRSKAEVFQPVWDKSS
jgi:PPM family protein phosphatase